MSDPIVQESPRAATFRVIESVWTQLQAAEQVAEVARVVIRDLKDAFDNGYKVSMMDADMLALDRAIERYARVKSHGLCIRCDASESLVSGVCADCRSLA